MRSLLRHVVAVCLLTILSIGFASAKVTAQTVHVSGGSTQGGIFEPLLFSWHYPLPVDGGGWASNESVTIVLHGPMNTLGVPATDHNIATINADGTGAFNTQVQIPYDEGGAYSIIQPGLYQVVANGGVSGAAFATDKIVVSPATYKSDAVGIDWSTERSAALASPAP